MAKGHPPRKTPSTSRQGSRKGGGQASSSASNQCILIIFIVLVILWYVASISSIIILDKELEWRIQENIEGSDFYEKGLEDDSLAVISACIPGKRFSQEYIDASLTNKELFCNKWHAECILSREKYDTNATYSPKWEKLYLINRTLYESSADWIMWMDCDAAFTNMDINWKSHLSGYLDRRKDLIASKDKNFINLGVLFVSNTLHAREFIKKMWDKRHWIDAHPNKLELKDQAALKMLILEDEKVRKGVNSDIPQELINSFLDNNDGHTWRKGEWIAHQVWCQETKYCQNHFLFVLRDIATKMEFAAKGGVAHAQQQPHIVNGDKSVNT